MSVRRRNKQEISLACMVMENFFIFVLGIAIAGITIIALTYQIRMQRKATSASVSLEMLKRMRDDDFRDTVKFLKSGTVPKSGWDKDLELLKFLNHFEDMAMFEEDGVLNFEHIKQMHGHILKLIKSNADTQRLIKKWSDEDPNFYFIFLRRLLNSV